MGIADENNGTIGEESLANQLAEDSSWWAYPSFEPGNVDTGTPVSNSDIMQEGIDQQSVMGPQPTDWIDALQQNNGPMKITEEALESMKAQEAEQAAAEQNQALNNQLTEEPVENDNSYSYAEDPALQTENLMDDTNTLWEYGGWEERVTIKRYNSWFVRSVLWMIIFWWLAYISYLFYQYLEYKSLPVIPSDREKTVTMVSDNYDNYGQKFWLFNLETYKVIYLENEINKVDDLLNDSTLNFNQKKDDLQRSLLRLGNEIVRIKGETKVLREKMNKEWFFPPELVWILEADNAISSIQRSLTSLEVVKFSSALRVFSLMDDIVDELADSFDFTRTNIKERMEELINRWEQDVEYYLNVCYNNPYEPEECTNINDFDKYYKTIKEEEEFDTTFFKKLMKYINNQIEYNELPSFSITFNSFDWKSNSITFSVEVNTTIEDETALIEQWIKSPHIFIISELIKLLKQSTFIVGKAIDAKNVKVVPKIINVAGRQFSVNNSVNTYTLPIQKTTEREIFDFMETYMMDIQETWFDMSWFMLSWFDMSWFMLSGFDLSWFMLSWFDMSGFNMSGFNMSWEIITWDIMSWDVMTWDIMTWSVWTGEIWSWDIQFSWWITDELVSEEWISTGVEVVYSWEVEDIEEQAGFIPNAQL